MYNQITDFTGECNISQNRFAKIDYEAIITAVETSILKELLGEDLYLKLVATPASYTDLINGCTYSVVNEFGVTVNISYLGIKPMLKYFTYAELLKHQDSQNTEVGQMEPDQENSRRMAKNHLNNLVSTAYNKGVALYGYDIESWRNDNSFICGRRNKEVKSEQDYWKIYVTGNCFNYLYKNKAVTAFLTWQFKIKQEMFMNGFL